MKGSLKYFILSAALFWCCNQASAQRTMPGRSTVAIMGGWNGSSVRAGAFFGQYTLNGYWEAGLVGDEHMIPMSVGGKLHCDDVVVSGEYQFRMAAARSRVFNLYGGGGVFLGAELVDPMRRLPDYLSLPVPSVSFQWGIYAKMVAELYLGRRLAVTASASVPLTPGNKFRVLGYTVGIGLKMIL